MPSTRTARRANTKIDAATYRARISRPDCKNPTAPSIQAILGIIAFGWTGLLFRCKVAPSARNVTLDSRAVWIAAPTRWGRRLAPNPTSRPDHSHHGG